MSVRAQIGWKLMGIPWLTTGTMKRGFARNNWHARLYFFGSDMASR